MPMLGLGVWQVTDGRETEQAVEWALEAGYRHIDTAQLLPQRAERRRRGRAQRPPARGGLRDDEVAAASTRGPAHELERSLERLGLAYVDLYLIHWPLPGRTGGAWPEFEELRERGLARAIGVSNYGVEPARAACSTARPAAGGEPGALQPAPLPAQAARALRAARRRRSRPTARSSAAAGSTTRPSSRSPGRAERTPAQVMLRWGIQRGAVVIPKSVHRDRIRENAAIFDFSLSDEDMRALDALDRTDGTGRAR